MLLGIAIGLSKEWSAELVRTTANLALVEIRKSVEHIPGDEELASILRTVAPQVVFLGLDSSPHALDVVRRLAAAVPGLQVVGVSATLDAKLLLEAMRFGIRELLDARLDLLKVAEVMDRVEAMVQQRPPQYESTDRLYCFLPSKPGVGASTIALNAAFALSGMNLGRVLLADFDLSSGATRYMLKLRNPRSVVDVARDRLRLDEDLWREHVSNLGSLDVLPGAAYNPNDRIEPHEVTGLLDFTRRMYGAICADLSGNLEAYSLSIMRQARRIYLVCTPEISSLHLASQKCRWLEREELGGRVRILLNRSPRFPVLSRRQVEELLGLPVEMTFPNDYQGVERALMRGRDVAPTSHLGRQFAGLAGSMAAPDSEPQLEAGRRFVKYFSITPARYTL